MQARPARGRSELGNQGRMKQGFQRYELASYGAYRLLETSEVDGEGALVAARAERRHGDVGHHGGHHEGGEAEEEGEHQQVPQPRHLLHRHLSVVPRRSSLFLL